MKPPNPNNTAVVEQWEDLEGRRCWRRANGDVGSLPPAVASAVVVAIERRRLYGNFHPRFVAADGHGYGTFAVVEAVGHRQPLYLTAAEMGGGGFRGGFPPVGARGTVRYDCDHYVWIRERGDVT